jgi:catechol 2,3-dioxygenase-like lactoylglutathione lyase family enzyme
LVELIQYFSPPGRATADGSPADVGAHHIALAVKDLHALYNRLAGAGIRFTCAPVQVTAGFFKGVLTTYCFDPDGLVIELWQPVAS